MYARPKGGTCQPTSTYLHYFLLLADLLVAFGCCRFQIRKSAHLRKERARLRIPSEPSVRCRPCRLQPSCLGIWNFNVTLTASTCTGVCVPEGMTSIFYLRIGIQGTARACKFQRRSHFEVDGPGQHPEFAQIPYRVIRIATSCLPPDPISFVLEYGKGTDRLRSVPVPAAIGTCNSISRNVCLQAFRPRTVLG